MFVDDYQTLGLLTTSETTELARQTGVEALTGELWDWTIGRYAPLHIRNEHGDAAAEAARGQRVPTPDDYGVLPRIIAAPDRLWAEDDGQTVLMEKTIGRDRYLVAWGVQTRRRMLSIKSMRVYHRTPRAQRP